MTGIAPFGPEPAWPPGTIFEDPQPQPKRRFWPPAKALVITLISVVILLAIAIFQGTPFCSADGDREHVVASCNDGYAPCDGNQFDSHHEYDFVECYTRQGNFVGKAWVER